MPDEWEAPLDIQKPTPYPEVNISIRLLSCEYLDFETRAAVGRFVSAEAEYDIWYLGNVKSAGWEMVKSAHLREIPMEQTRLVYEAWRVFEEIDYTRDPRDVVRERRRMALAGLQAALQEAVDSFHRARRENSPGH
ncbi:hypothetical protein [Catenulispora yoronensis]